MQLKQEEPEAWGRRSVWGVCRLECVGVECRERGVAGDGARLERVRGFARPEGSHSLDGLSS